MKAVARKTAAKKKTAAKTVKIVKSRGPAAGKPKKAPKSPKPKASAKNAWQLRLYVMDETPKSLAAFANLKTFCETHLKGRYRIKVIDLKKHPQLAKGDQILAVPTVVRELPAPVRTLIGTLSDTKSLLVGLDLRHTETTK
jgi:circadian clock protein KaiB